MNWEIERKFLVKKHLWNIMDKPSPKIIQQGYLSKTDNSGIRVRIKNDQGFITIKYGKSSLIRKEFEYEIPLSDAKELIAECCSTIKKLRYEFKLENHLWEVDVFEETNSGLIIAEIELESEDAYFEKPDWIDKEVSEDSRYLNINLIDHPFSQW